MYAWFKLSEIQTVKINLEESRKMYFSCLGKSKDGGEFHRKEYKMV